VVNDDETPSTVEVFENPPEPPPVGNKEFLFRWESIRDQGILPAHQSELDPDPTKREEFLEGARLLGLLGRSKTLMPQQLRLSDVCAVSRQFVAVLLPRRSSKTTSLFAVALGRCLGREDYLVGYTTCTTGQKARDRFRKDIVPVLERMFPDKATAPFKIRKAGGSERIEFANGSIFQVLPPIGESFRSDSFDLVILDEAGEASPEMTEDLKAGILPTMDTRVGAQLVVAGTAAKYRKGNLLWDTLVDGRADQEDTSIIEYAAPDETEADVLEDWDQVLPLVLASHPGVGFLTPIEKIKTNWQKLNAEQFAQEYLSIFGTAGASQGLIDPVPWAQTGVDGALPTPPDSFALSIAVHPDGNTASVGAAWRVDGVAQLMVLKNGKPAEISKEALRLARKYKLPIVHDSMAGATQVEVEGLMRAKPRPRFSPQTWPNVSTAASLLVKEITASNVVHWRQPVLDEAVRIATKRGTPNSNRWSFGKPKTGADATGDITPVEAVAIALRAYDEKGQRRVYTPKMAS
jgi:hypothetical protein